MKIVLKKFGAAWCPPCQALDKRQTLEKLVEKHLDELRVEVHNDTEAGSERFAALADKWKVKALPTFIWLAGGEELFRSTDYSVAGLEAQFQRALKKAERL